MALPSAERRQLAHLLRRAGFGARPDEWEEYARLGLDGATQRLLHPETVPDRMAEILKNIGGDYVDFENLESIKQWWLYRMVHTPRPLEEKMTLFWHNHFATANFKVNNARWMWQQNETFRKLGLGSFRTLLQEVARDAAMLVWLDGAANKNGAPNENFAREVMELFSLGVDGGYTEKDVQEAARCFTGWRFDNGAGKFVFDPFLHDDGEKTVLGQTGNFYSDDVVDIIARHPSTARFLSTKLFKFFVHDNPAPADISGLQQVYFKSGYNIRAMIESLFKSPVFYSDVAYFAKIKSPVEFAVMTVRTLNAPMAMNTPLYAAIAAMGQDLFNPPNVKGWNEGRAWINGRTLLARVNFAIQMANDMGRRGGLQHLLADLAPGAPARPQPAAVAPSAGAAAGPKINSTTMQAPAMAGATMQGDTMQGGAMATQGGAVLLTAGNASPEQIVDTLWNAFLTGHAPSPKTRGLLIDYLKEGTTDKPERVTEKLPGLVNIILSAPEYQLA